MPSRHQYRWVRARFRTDGYGWEADGPVSGTPRQKRTKLTRWCIVAAASPNIRPQPLHV